MSRQEHLVVDVPGWGELRLPKAEDLAYYAGIGVLVALELVDWPAALVLGVGHVLLSQRHNRVIREFGEALETV